MPSLARTDAAADETEAPRDPAPAAPRGRRPATQRPRRTPRTGAPRGPGTTVHRLRHRRLAAAAIAASGPPPRPLGRPRRHPSRPVDPTRQSRRARDPREPPRAPASRRLRGPYGAPFEARGLLPARAVTAGPGRRAMSPAPEPRNAPRADDRYDRSVCRERPRRPAPAPHHPVSRVRYRGSEDESARPSHRPRRGVHATATAEARLLTRKRAGTHRPRPPRAPNCLRR